MPLNVIVIGAGIAGLTAATSLCKSGHSVQIFEKSSFKTEVGAALNLMPNGAIVLAKLGFDFKRALVGRHQRLETVNGVNLEPLTHINLTNVEKDYGGHMQSVLRADLHSELLLLSQRAPNPAALHLGSPVKRVDSTEGKVELQSGEVHTADLIIAADGSHSVCRSEVLGYDQPPTESGNNAFRFLIRTEMIEDLDEIKKLIPGRVPGATIFADVNDKLKTRHLAWYDCHGGALQNFVGIYPAVQHVEDMDHKTMLLEQFQHFHPRIVNLLKLADDVRVWPLRFDEPLERYTRGRLVLIGDAAHTMLPFSGQGANQGIEGAGILGEMFQDVDAVDVPERVKEFEEMRKKRITTIKLLSRIRFGRENDAAYSNIKHDEIDPKDIPRSFHERLLFEWRHNIFDEFRERQKATSLGNRHAVQSV
ncbi:putative salicylate hydroxylase [Zopfia rhizophila CBS 207.26]|uniref:Putative salicylate hydroxylase n=1 Tax=Zopfia rhizophila CBS 207.26 TaxID=1314779 RepID=A0A6A6DZI5_9PEZI|nr:putative salicylate hydroxylase [Zopfia rhizophila CBS 207.26]